MTQVARQGMDPVEAIAHLAQQVSRIRRRFRVEYVCQQYAPAGRLVPVVAAGGQQNQDRSKRRQSAIASQTLQDRAKLGREGDRMIVGPGDLLAGGSPF